VSAAPDLAADQGEEIVRLSRFTDAERIAIISTIPGLDPDFICALIERGASTAYALAAAHHGLTRQMTDEWDATYGGFTCDRLIRLTVNARQHREDIEGEDELPANVIPMPLPG